MKEHWERVTTGILQTFLTGYITYHGFIPPEDIEELGRECFPNLKNESL